jgi:hypothetical protein
LNNRTNTERRADQHDRDQQQRPQRPEPGGLPGAPRRPPAIVRSRHQRDRSGPFAISGFPCRLLLDPGQPLLSALVGRVDAKHGTQAKGHVLWIVKNAAEPEPGLLVLRIELDRLTQQRCGQGFLAAARRSDAACIQLLGLLRKHFDTAL